MEAKAKKPTSERSNWLSSPRAFLSNKLGGQRPRSTLGQELPPLSPKGQAPKTRRSPFNSPRHSPKPSSENLSAIADSLAELPPLPPQDPPGFSFHKAFTAQQHAAEQHGTLAHPTVSAPLQLSPVGKPSALPPSVPENHVPTHYESAQGNGLQNSLMFSSYNARQSESRSADQAIFAKSEAPVRKAEITGTLDLHLDSARSSSDSRLPDINLSPPRGMPPVKTAFSSDNSTSTSSSSVSVSGLKTPPTPPSHRQAPSATSVSSSNTSGMAEPLAIYPRGSTPRGLPSGIGGLGLGSGTETLGSPAGAPRSGNRRKFHVHRPSLDSQQFSMFAFEQHRAFPPQAGPDAVSNLQALYPKPPGGGQQVEQQVEQQMGQRAARAAVKALWPRKPGRYSMKT